MSLSNRGNEWEVLADRIALRRNRKALVDRDLTRTVMPQADLYPN